MEHRRARRRVKQQRELAEAAVALAQENGFTNTTVEEIANAADYSVSTFFRLFPRKEDVIFFDLRERLGAMLDDFARDDHESAWATVRRTFIDNAREWETSDPEFALARIRLFQTEPVLRSRYLENLAEWEAAVAAMVARERGVDSGDFECWLVASMAVAAYRAAFSAQLTDAETHFADHVERAFDALEVGFAARGLTSR
ncbi:MAG TPA: TetR family transcriptional regulator [Jatrophihabitantaceae bacterium]|nr:TetR family transcriptional regulator [Jatrophihabitantaceae bacterium]